MIEISENVREISLEITSVSGDSRTYGITDLAVFEGNAELDPSPYIRLPSEADSLKSFDTPISFLFSRLVDNSEEVIRRKFSTSQNQVFNLAGAVDSVRTNKDRLCLPIIEIDGRPIYVRPVEGSTWATKTVNIEGCEEIQLAIGPHTLEENFTFTTRISGLTLIDHRSQRLRRPLNSLTMPITDTRFSAYEHSYSLPAGSGFLATNTPRHQSWRFEASFRSAQSLQGFAKTIWWVDEGSQTTATTYFRAQTFYEMTLGISGALVIVCLILATRKERR